MEAMTERLYLDDAYCWENDALVQAVDGCDLILDRTCMYPGGGGQPADTGEITLQSGAAISVLGALKGQDGGINHRCASPPPLGLAGTPCKVRLDGERRLNLMRYHTALHVFNTVMLREFNGWITGVGIGPAESRIDFKVDNYSDEMRRRLEREVNVILEKDSPVKAYYITGEEFRNRPDLLRTLEAKPPIENERVRVVEIEGFEAQACGGTHVRSTKEVGSLAIKKVDNKGRNNRRFYVTLSAVESKERVGK